MAKLKGGTLAPVLMNKIRWQDIINKGVELGKSGSAIKIFVPEGRAGQVVTVKGRFNYDGVGDLSGGTVTGLTSSLGKKTLISISGFSMPVEYLVVLLRDAPKKFASVLFGRNDTLTGTKFNDWLDGHRGNDKLSGGLGADRLNGGDGNDSLDGGAGADRLTGGKGNDTYMVDDAGDLVIENGARGSGTDLVLTTASYALTSHVENLQVSPLAGAANLNLTGNALDNVISANDGANTISGLGGNDRIFGRGGNDAIYGGEGNDLLYGEAGDDLLVGEGGADTMHGGDGNDTYEVDSSDSVTEFAGQGIDTVRTSTDRVLDAEVENLELTGSAVAGTGNALANRITGNGANNTLNGAAGADTLTGGEGRDVFVFDATSLGAADSITDFSSGADVIALVGGVFAGLNGTVTAAKIANGPVATDADDRIVYNSTTGVLSYDADGNGGSAAVAFAKINAGSALTVTDFIVI
ncbi:MAG TPA: calcium-binding protein [Microvirga sp.]|jgi:Ca2+-binding RTX toxin-like protein